jgi:hypothetical protein
MISNVIDVLIDAHRGTVIVLEDRMSWRNVCIARWINAARLMRFVVVIIARCVVGLIGIHAVDDKAVGDAMAPFCMSRRGALYLRS